MYTCQKRKETQTNTSSIRKLLLLTKKNEYAYVYFAYIKIVKILNVMNIKWKDFKISRS